MDKYLERIFEKESEIDKIDQTINDKKDSLEILKKEKQEKERLIADLSLEYTNNNQLKQRIIDLPDIKRTLKRVTLLFGAVFLLPPTLILGVLAVSSGSLVFSLLILFFDIVIGIKMSKDYNQRLNELESLVEGLTPEGLDASNMIVDSKKEKIKADVAIIENLMQEIKLLIAQCEERKKGLKEDINHTRFMRESAIKDHCESVLNEQFEADNKGGFQKRHLPSTEALNK